jgi:hypothetical protein
VKGHRAHIVVGLLVEGLVLSLVLMIGLWGIVALGSQTVVRETHYSPMAQSAPKKYVAVCHAPDTSKKGAALLLGAAGDEGGDCPPKDWPHTTTSRQPGAGLARLNQLEDN